MTEHLDPLRATIKSKKFQVAIFWAIGLLFIAYYQATRDEAVDLIRSASIVLAAYLLGQGFADGMAARK